MHFSPASTMPLHVVMPAATDRMMTFRSDSPLRFLICLSVGACRSSSLPTKFARPVPRDRVLLASLMLMSLDASLCDKPSTFFVMSTPSDVALSADQFHPGPMLAVPRRRCS